MKHYLKEKILYNGILTTDIFKRYKVIDKMKTDGKFFFQYYIQENETPEVVAKKIYGSEEWWWLVLLYADIINPWEEWPCSVQAIDDYTKLLVPDWETNPSEYATTYTAQMTINDNRKNINLLRPEYLTVVIKNMNGIK